MAQAFKRLGCEQVTVVEALDRLLANEEPFVGEEVRAAFEAEDIGVIIGAKLTAARGAAHPGARAVRHQPRCPLAVSRTPSRPAAACQPPQGARP
jgi:pyruvate/2-oxoglutarate dehydrogenase complex dihydrolipoamide dehydrogenase (E3) component